MNPREIHLTPGDVPFEEETKKRKANSLKDPH